MTTILIEIRIIFYGLPHRPTIALRYRHSVQIGVVCRVSERYGHNRAIVNGPKRKSVISFYFCGRDKYH